MKHFAVQMIPTAISGLRVVIGMAFPWIPPEWRLPAVALGALSDLLDGPISRRLGADGFFGRVLDPVADKIFLACVLATILWESNLAWWEVLLVGIRDLAIVIACAGMILRQGWNSWQRMRARWPGKITTGLQIAFLLALLWGAEALARFLVIPTALVGVLAVVDYIFAYRRSNE